MTDNQLKRVEKAFYNDCSNHEIAAYAGISMMELLEFIALNTENGWYQRMCLFPHARYAKANINLGKSIDDGDMEDSKFVLERRRGDKWGKKVNIDVTSSVNPLKDMSDEELLKLSEANGNTRKIESGIGTCGEGALTTEAS